MKTIANVYEYKTVTNQNELTEKTLNDLGANGWELIGNPVYKEHTGFSYIFKRLNEKPR